MFRKILYLMFQISVFYNFLQWQQLQGVSQSYDLDRISSSGRKVKWISLLQDVDCFVFERISLYTILDINDTDTFITDIFDIDFHIEMTGIGNNTFILQTRDMRCIQYVKSTSHGYYYINFSKQVIQFTYDMAFDLVVNLN